ncbi:hypothetical protein HanXRQr2_Chr04g0164121 [Helianthus annuus]|uniref:Uncharacterized protein n=1 Tax=Helianthus annuus TaxID=4232 RepID=A0A9K3J7S1_HELAN|nr:hypothetical protein HanXRQr2_Chr04g0164121 [Helianthus annuus]KAJ0931141.1 hypothetical protein HanPSC8_Chr04g0158051 [Helianthus annuus]
MARFGQRLRVSGLGSKFGSTLSQRLVNSRQRYCSVSEFLVRVLVLVLQVQQLAVRLSFDVRVKDGQRVNIWSNPSQTRSTPVNRSQGWSTQTR